MKRWVTIALAAAVGMVALSWLTANWMLCSAVARLDELFADTASRGLYLAVRYDDRVIEFCAATNAHLRSSRSKTAFVCDGGDFSHTRQALAELAASLTVPKWVAVGLWLHPFVIGVRTVQDTRCWVIWLRGGKVRLAWVDGLPREIRYRNVRLNIQRPASAVVPAGKTVSVEPVDMDRSLAAVVRLLALQLVEVSPEPDAIRHEGNGSLVIQNGRRLLRLSGQPYEIGFQHGRLLASNIHRLAERIVYGVGLSYSLETGRWFPHEAARLVERQRRFIEPAYFEEMRGLADGSGVPLALIQAANIFPEFFHCSGLAVFGKATRDGRLFHARVLDYLTEVGLQDEAVTIAVARDGARRFVNVSYAGFIGSVTGMNEQQVAIGEMGGRGEGQWDGTPMAFLVRGALEHCDTLEQVLDYMRGRPRTCEYYYVISDGKLRTARGVAATPERFEVVEPGQPVPLLPEAIEDAVVLSADERYTELVKRVRNFYGRIGVEELQQILTRPVAMRSNLHNVIFEPAALTLWIAHAGRRQPACDRPYVKYTWQDLFGR